MRQSVFVLFLFFIGVIVGCGGSGGYKNSAGTLSSTKLAAGNTQLPGTTTAGATTPPSSTGSASNTTPTNPATPSSSTSATEVVISSPVEGATVGSPAQVAASVVGPTAIASMQLYVDDAVTFQSASSQINAAVQLPTGTHTMVAQAWDQNGNAYKSVPVHVLVQASAVPAAPPAPTPAPPTSAANASQIQTQGGWDNCDVCAGDAGNGPSTAHAMVEGVSSPSLSGSSARFDIGGTPWGAALFWRELGSHDEAQNLRYDLDFYVDSISSGQALEFDVNQTTGGSKYIFGTECDFRGSGTWRVWNAPAATWASTGIGCAAPSAGTWHHLTWEFQRGGGQTHFIAVTLDGNRHDVGINFGAIGQSGSGLDIAFQADLTASGSNQSVWLDNVSLSW